MSSQNIEIFFDEETFTATYLVYDLNTKDAVVIDTVLNLDLASGVVSSKSADDLLLYIDNNQLNLHCILETHVHADHLTASQYLKNKTNAKVGIGAEITTVQKEFSKLYNLKNLSCAGDQFDLLLSDGQKITAGSIDINVIHTPGHTPACVTYIIGKNAFIGDTLFMPDFGSARCDFPGGSAEKLYQSIQKILSLGDDVTLYVGHDYAPNGRDFEFASLVSEHLKANIHVNADTTKDGFVKMRQERDSTLSVPRLLLPSLQVNINAGELPVTEDNGTSYLKIPLVIEI